MGFWDKLGISSTTSTTTQQNQTKTTTPQKRSVPTEYYYNGFAMDEVISKRHRTDNLSREEDKHGVRSDAKANVSIEGDMEHPTKIIMTDPVSHNKYVYEQVSTFNDKSKLSKEYGEDDYILVSAQKPDGTDIMSKDHYEVYHMTVDYNPNSFLKGSYRLYQPQGYDGSGKSSINLRA